MAKFSEFRVPPGGFLITSPPKLKIRKDLTIPSHIHPWMIDCPVPECEGPQLGVNSGCGVESHFIAVQVAEAHVIWHRQQLKRQLERVPFKDDPEPDWFDQFILNIIETFKPKKKSDYTEVNDG